MAIVTGTSGNDQDDLKLTGTAEDDQILGLEGDDELVGLEGDDTLDGGAGSRDEANYETDPAGIIGNLFLGTVTDGFGDTDTLIGIERVVGTAFADQLIAGGTDGDFFLFGGDGDDQITQLAGNNSGFTALYGEGGNDTLISEGGVGFFEPGTGNDTITGSVSGFDIVGYFFSAGFSEVPPTTGVTFLFTSEQGGSVTDYAGGTDLFTNIDRAEGTMLADVMTGTDGRQDFRSFGGDDTIDGGAGLDRIDYSHGRDDFASLSGVIVNLSTGIATDAFGDTDTLISIEEVRGTDLDDEITGGIDDDFRLRGQGGDDILRNVTGNVNGFGDLDGGAGNDFLINEGGSTFLQPGTGNDTITGSANGFDTLSYFFSAGYDNPPATMGITATYSNQFDGTVIDYAGGTDTFTNIDRIEGTMLADLLTGTNGYQEFRSFGGNDTIDGGADQDLIDYSHGRDDFRVPSGVIVDLAAETATDAYGDTDTLIGIENVRGTGDDDVIQGSSADNRLEGRAGDDSIIGLDGDDELRGEEGNDTLLGGEGRDDLYGGAGNDTLDGGAGDRDEARYNDAPGAITADLDAGTVTDGWGDTDTLIGIEEVRGSAFDDVLRGGTGQITYLRGEDGNDSLTGADGDFETGLYGGDGDDTLHGGEGGAFMNPGRGTDLIFGGAAEDGFFQVQYVYDADQDNAAMGIVATFTAERDGTIVDYDGSTDTFTGIDRVAGTMLADYFIGTEGNQDFRGEGGNDTFEGGEGDRDRIDYSRPISEFGGLNGVVVDMVAGLSTDPYGDTDTFSGIERIRGTGFNDTIEGNSEENNLQGREGDDLINGAEGDDNLFGDGGNDTLIGGSENDYFEGGDGADVFVIAAGGGFDFIGDFEIGVDTLDLTGFNRADALAAFNSAQNGSVILNFADGTSLTVEGDNVSVATLTLDDIELADENNAPFIGRPTLVVGTVQEDETISVDVQTITDDDGIDTNSYQYQWQRNGQDIEGATGASYQLVQGDVGAKVRALVTLSDLNGNTEARASLETVPVENVNDAPFVNGNPYNESVQLGRFFSFGRGSDRFVDEDPDDTLTLSATLADGSPLPDWLSFNPLDGWFSGTPPLDLVESVEVRMRATDEQGAFADDVFTINLRPANNPTEGELLILGIAEEDQTLTVDLSGITDADGYNPADITVEWFRDGETVAVGTGLSYTLDQADVGSEIRAEASFRDDDFNPERVVSEPTAAVANVNDPLEGPSTVTGDGEVGETLTVSFEQLSDPDGIDRIEVQWYRLDTDFEVVEAIPDAIDTGYTITEEDLGFWISPWAQVFDDFGNQQLRTNLGRFVNQEPVGLPAITGAVEPGETVGVDLTGIGDPDGLQEDRVSYIWFRDGVEISGATDATYTVEAGDVAAELSVQVTYRDEGNILEVVTSPTVTVLPEPQTITGTPGDDPLVDLTGEVGRETILALGGNDQLSGGPGDDTLDGGPGTDTAVFAGTQAGYTLTLSPTTTTITDRRSDGEGTDQLSGIELLDFGTEIPLFGGNPMNLSIFDGPTTLTAPQFSEIIELYIAYFNRAPDALGLFYWATEFANGFTVPDMAANFFGQPETQATYASVLDATGNLDITDATKVGDFVTAVYNNVLGRGPDTPGFDYWVGELTNNPLITPGVFILAIIGGAKIPGNPTPQTDLDQAYLATKSDLGAYFSVIKGMSDIPDATASMALFSAADIEGSRDATIAAIDGHYADALDPDTGDFLMPLVGVIDDPFGIV